MTPVHAPPAPSTSRPTADWHRAVLAVDAVGCLGIGVGVLLGSAPLAAGFALSGRGAVLVAGVLLLVAAGVNGVAARRPHPARTWPTLVAIDLDVVFALWMALTLAAGQGEPWTRALALVGLIVCVVMAGLKTVGAWRGRG